MTACRVLIAEDEPLAREQLERLVLRHDRLELLGTVANGTDAVAMIDELKPDAVFLDIRMPGASGIEVVRRIRHRPYVVFTTAYDEFAVTAFELQALDYLLKPFGKRRFDRTVLRLLEQDRAGYADRLRDGLDEAPVSKVFVRDRGSMKGISVANIVRIEAADDYCRIVGVEGSPLLVAIRMKALMTRLDPTRFVRVHRSTIVNIDHIDEIRNVGNGRRVLIMRDGTSCAASRTGSDRLRAAVGE